MELTSQQVDFTEVNTKEKNLGKVSRSVKEWVNQQLRVKRQQNNDSVAGNNSQQSCYEFSKNGFIYHDKITFTKLTANFIKVICSMMIFMCLFTNQLQAQQRPNINPISGGYAVTSGFGSRIHPFSKKQTKHRGIDFRTPMGTPVFATADGVVLKVASELTGYGNHIKIAHGSAYETLYAHLSKIMVKENEKVKKGQLIGYTGNSGRSSSPHLHYEVRKSGQSVDPVNYLELSK